MLKFSVSSVFQKRSWEERHRYVSAAPKPHVSCKKRDELNGLMYANVMHLEKRISHGLELIDVLVPHLFKSSSSVDFR